MNGRVAHGAGLILLGLVVERGNGCRTRIHCEGVAFQAEQVHLATFQEPRIRGPVRRMAGHATLDLDGFVLVDERTLLVGMALKADQVLRTCGAQLTGQEAAVWIVAIAALHQSFVHAVMKSASELLLGLQVAAVTKLRLLLLHQELTFLRVVGIVAIRTPDIILEVRGTPEVAVFFPILMAIQAPRADLLRRGVLERENLRLIAAAIDVSLPWTVAGLASMPLGSFLRIQRGDEVRGSFIVLEEILHRHVFVAGFTCLGTHVE